MKEREGLGGKDEMTVSSHWNFFFYPAGRRKKDEVNLHKRAYASVSSRVRFLISFFISFFLHFPLHSLPSRRPIYATSQYTVLLLKRTPYTMRNFQLSLTQ